MTFDTTNLLTGLGIIGALLLFARSFGKWEGRLDGMLRELKASVERNGIEILSLRESRHDHGEDIILLKAQTASLETDMGEVMESQRQQNERRRPR